MKKLANFLLLCTAITPLLVYKNYLSPFIDAKVLFLRGISFAVILLIGFILVSKNNSKNNDKVEILNKISELKKDKLFKFVSVYIGLMILSTIFAFNPYVAFFGEPLRAEGFLTVFAIYSLYVGFLILFSKKEWNKFFVITIFTTIILFIIQARQSALGMYRSDSLTGNPIFLSSYYLFSLFAGFMVIRLGNSLKNGMYNFLGSVGLILAFIGILLTKTRGTMLAVFVGFLIVSLMAIIYGKSTYIKKNSFRKIGIWIIALMICFSALFLATRKSQFWQHIPGLNRFAQISVSDNTATSRIEYTKVSLRGFFHDQSISQTFLGWGQTNYQFFWIKNYDPVFFYYDQGIADHAHNQLIDILVMSGIFGFVIYLIIWVLFVKKINQLTNTDLILALGIVFWSVGYFVNNLFAFDTAMTLLTFYIMISFISKSYEK